MNCKKHINIEYLLNEFCDEYVLALNKNALK